MSRDDFKVTKKLTEEFLGGGGAKLHKQLSDINAATALQGKYPYSFVEKYWDQLYLGDRSPLPLNSNPFYILQSEKGATQINRAAKFVNVTAKFWRKVVSGKLEADVEVNRSKNKANPLCMYQFSNLLGCQRVSGEKVDSSEFHPFSEHIVVGYKNNYFRVPIIQGDGVVAVPILENLFEEVKQIGDELALKKTSSVTP